jgi:hypothetical protein
MKTGPKEPRSTVLTEAEEAMVVAFRRHTLLPLDDCLYAPQPSIPHLTRSALHRCLQRHGISRLPDVEGDKPRRQKFKRYPTGFFHIDIAEVQTAEGKLFLFVGIERTAKFAVAQLVDTANRNTAWEFLQHMLEAVPYHVHTVLTDNGIQFAEQPRNRNTISSRPMRFDMICEANGIEHRLTKPNHPWTNGQVERINRTIKDAAVKALERMTVIRRISPLMGRPYTLKRSSPVEARQKNPASRPRFPFAKPGLDRPSLYRTLAGEPYDPQNRPCPPRRRSAG